LNRKLVPAVVATTIALSLALPVPSFAGPTAEQLTRQLKELEQQQAQIKKNVENTKQQVSSVRTDKARAEQDLDSILRQIDETNERLAELNEQVEQVTAELEDNIRQLDEAEERVKSRDNLLKSRLRLMYTSGFVSYLDVLMSATSFTDFLDRLEALKSVVVQDKQILENNIRDRNLIEEKKNEVELQLAQVQQLYAETEAIKQDLLVQEKEKEVRIASLSAKEKELVEITEEEQRKNDEIIRKKAEIQKQLDELNRTSRPAYQGGTLAYPLPKVVPITSEFGSRVDPITKKSGAFHQGLDLGAPNGTDILAAEAGVVITAGWLSGYGNTVVIDHGNELWTLYGQIPKNAILVQEGQEVKRGQKSAEVGMTGRATGYHLHFEVRLNGKYVDPKPYLNLK